jgi:cytidylate kinase
VLQNRISLNDSEAIGRIVENTRIDFKLDKKGLKIMIDDKDVTAAIRTPEVDRAVGPVCEVTKVREVMVRKQRDIASNRQIIAEGRDMGTVVFPQADLKFYMVASIDERAKRRQEDLAKQSIHMSLDQIKNELQRRDDRDSTRSNSPLMQAKDAICIDTTKMKIKEQVDFIIDQIKKKQIPIKRNFQ